MSDNPKTKKIDLTSTYEWGRDLEVDHKIVQHADGEVDSDWFKPHLTFGLSNWGPSVTRQEYKDDCDINNIMSRFASGELPDFNRAADTGEYFDFTSVPSDLMSSLNIAQQAGESFNSLPAEVRREFDNDAFKFAKFASDKGNLPKMQQWGLAPKPEGPKPPMEVRVIPDPPIEPAPKPAPKAPGGA